MSDVMPTSDPAVVPSPAPSVADLQAEIASARDGLVASLNELKAQTSPGALARRGGRNVAGLFTDEFGGIRPERVAIVGAVVLGLVAIGLIRRGRG